MKQLRIAIVALLAVWLLATVTPTVKWLWAPFGSYGFTTDYDQVVDGITPHGSAARAGLHVGDRIDVMRASAADRRPFRLTGAAYAVDPGTPMDLPMLRKGIPRTLHLVAQSASLDWITGALLVVRTLSALAFVVVGAWLLLSRPSVMTWAFYMYCIGTEPGSVLGLTLLLPEPFTAIQAILVTVAGDLALLGALSFALRFPSDRMSRGRRIIEAVAACLVIGIAVAEGLGQYASLLHGMAMQRVFNVTNVLQFVLTGAIYATFFVTYLRAPIDHRERIRYVIAGFTVALGGQLAETFLNRLGSPPYWLTSILDLMGIAVPIAVAYAVVRHRVIDVSFVMSRTIVYGILTTFVVVVYSLIDWLCSTLVSATRVETVAQVAASVGVGLSLSKLQKVTDRAVDRVFFRHRYDAEAKIRALTARIPHADSVHDVVMALVDEAAEALDLSSAAVFVRNDDVRELYERTHCTGWEGVTVERLFTDEQIVGKLARTQKLTTIGDLDLDGCALPEGIARPVLGLPIIIHEELAAVVLYGQHKSGATLDPEEEELLDRLADAAALAYDHIEAQRLREELHVLSRTVRQLERRLAASGGEPAPA